MLTQIYEISSPDEARGVSEIGIDHVGILVGDGEFPREQPLSQAAEIAAAIAAPARFSALFLTARVDLIIEWARALQPAIVHLGTAPELLAADQLATIKAVLPGRLIMRSVPVYGEESVRIARSYEGVADYLLLDSHRPSDKQIGALGLPHDWSISRRIVEAVGTPVILAGGLGPNNVAQAISIVRPAGVGHRQDDADDPERTFAPNELDPRAARLVSLIVSRIGGMTMRAASRGNPTSVLQDYR
ncbi:phosphoribosylanthranilate isomerase [Bradyrhizobium sp. AZCC 1578]|uniref:phosphoribosylanthranilate isomerase n=1 Tax=Bradyrhizobium sp. AZCC 1578 TaxID=3117027 RepID=UPI002FEEDE8A